MNISFDLVFFRSYVCVTNS